MTGRTNEDDERNSGDAISESLGGIPLAISQMAGVIARRDLSFSDFLSLYQAERARADLFKLRIDDLKPGSDYNHTIASVWALENLKRGSVLLEVLSLLDADGIPEYILDGSEACQQLHDYPQSSIEYQEARSELQKSSLITRERNTKKILIHRLIQDAARANMNDEGYDTIFSFTLSLLSSVWPYEEFGFGNGLQKLFSRFRPPNELSIRSLEAPKLILDAIWFKIMRGDNYSETTPLLDTARSMCEALQKGKQLSMLTDTNLQHELETLIRLFHHHQRVIALHTNQPKKALSHLQTFTDMLCKKLSGDKTEGGTDQSLGVAWNELGNAYLQNNLYREAEDAFTKSIDALRSLFNSTKISINMPLINLAFCYWLKGQLDKAGSTFEEALQEREREYGVDDTTSLITGKLLLGFGNVRAEQGRLEESFILHQRCLLQYKSTIGSNHHRTGDACVALSNHYVRLVQYDSALTLLDQAHKIYGDLPHFMPERVRVNYKRGNLLKLMSRAKETEQNLETASDLYRLACPDDDRSLMELDDKAFNSIITFWSR